MPELIYECVVSTTDAAGHPHLAPMGVRYRDDDRVLLMPFKPSTTLDNILATGVAGLNILTDTRVFAGCVTGRREWPLSAMERLCGVRLQAALRHLELQLESVSDDPQRPVLTLQAVHSAEHAPFLGLNRAQAAVLEGAVLVSRLRLLPPEKIDTEMAYLQIAIDKTAAPEELQAWAWLREAITAHRSRSLA